jgi:hypothetical protein
MIVRGSENGTNADPDRDRKVQKDLAQIDTEETKYLKKGTIRQQDAQQVAKTVKQQNPIFKSITVVEGRDSWDYQMKLFH